MHCHHSNGTERFGPHINISMSTEKMQQHHLWIPRVCMSLRENPLHTYPLHIKAILFLTAWVKFRLVPNFCMWWTPNRNCQAIYSTGTVLEDIKWASFHEILTSAHLSTQTIVARNFKSRMGVNRTNDTMKIVVDCWHGQAVSSHRFNSSTPTEHN